MIKKTIKYTDYNGVERTEDFYFNLTKAELMEMELGTIGGMSNILEEIVAASEVDQLVIFFKQIILKSYGRKSPDGRQFVKNQELVDSFTQTEAYSELFMELASNTEAAVEFVRGIMPADLVIEEAADQLPPRLKEVTDLRVTPTNPEG